jgi:hypothetical protein
VIHPRLLSDPLWHNGDGGIADGADGLLQIHRAAS